MKLFLHVGMGKTGTSSIQGAMKHAQEALHNQGGHYLGMWMDIIDPAYQGIQGVRDFLRSSPEARQEGAVRLVRHMQDIREKTGCETFVFSNEDLYGHVNQIGPFVNTLAEHVDLTIVMYVRDIQSWLPSAYVQWSIRHKTKDGPIRSFRDDAPRWVDAYRALDIWHRDFAPWLVVRKFDKTVDVVEDFSATIGLGIPKQEKRLLERAENAEVLLRALYNNRFPVEVFPNRFNAFVLNQGQNEVPTLEEAIETYLNFDQADQAIESRRAELEAIGERIGVDFLQGAAKDEGTPDPEELRRRMIDYLIEICLSQSVQLQKLSGRIRALEEKLG